MSHTRRDFLKAGLGASALLSLGPVTPNALTASRADERDTVLVIVQLSGGNDGLNTVIPYTDDAYARNRKTLRLPTADLHKIDDQVAFHPRMEPFLRLYQEGHLSIIHGVGHPKPDQSHDRAMRIWHTADPDRPERQTGWLGRTADHAWRPDTVETTAVFVGPIVRPFALNAECATVPRIRTAQDLVARTMPGGPAAQPELADRIATPDSDLLALLRHAARTAQTQTKRVEAVINSSAGSGSYPSSGLARDLRTAAQLIRAAIGIRVIFVELGGGGIGGFDNHANQLGNHCALLGQLAEAVSAFVDDLDRDRLLDRVLLMTFSEFGRTVKENGRRGTGHGAAAPVFLVGGKVKGGRIGSHPSLTDLDNGGLKFHADFRRVYATVLDRWLGFDSNAVLGSRFEPLDVLKT